MPRPTNDRIVVSGNTLLHLFSLFRTTIAQLLLLCGITMGKGNMYCLKNDNRENTTPNNNMFSLLLFRYRCMAFA